MVIVMSLNHYIPLSQMEMYRAYEIIGIEYVKFFKVFSFM